MDTRKNEQAIAMYNSLRASPANSITLNELMQMYASMEEYDQAISAAGNFPLAVNNSEQCMSTLGRIYLAKNELPEALQWLTAATTRNQSLGEAHFFKAVALVNSVPPNLTSAIASARAARSAGYANADALLRDIEAKAQA